MTNQNTAALLGEDGDIEKLRALSDAAPAGPWDALTPEIVGCPSGERTNIAYAPGIAPFLAGSINYVRAALARANNTDPVRALIAKWRRQAAEHGTRTFTGNDHALFANELESALASAPPSAPMGAEGSSANGGWTITPPSAPVEVEGFDKRFAEMLLGILSDVQDELGFTDEDKLCANGSAEIVSAIRELKERAASAPPSAPVGVEWLRAELNASAAYAGDYIGDERVVLLAVAMRKIDKLAALAQQPAGVDEAAAQRLADAAKGDLGWSHLNPQARVEKARRYLALAAQQQGGAA